MILNSHRWELHAGYSAGKTSQFIKMINYPFSVNIKIQMRIFEVDEWSAHALLYFWDN